MVIPKTYMEKGKKKLHKKGKLNWSCPVIETWKIH